MRVTQNMLSNNMLHNLMNSQSKMDKYMEQLYTGKKISRPSDDPVIAMKGMNYRTQVTEIGQYKRNIGDVHNWMDNSDAALDQATKAMQRMRELGVQASNSPNSDADLQSIKAEVVQLKDHLIDIANTSVNDKHIFNGTETKEKPVTENEDGTIEVSEGANPVMIEVAKGTRLQVNVDPGKIFNEQFFLDIDTFIDGLDSGDVDESFGALDDNINNLINGRANLGARMNRLELIENRIDEQEVIATRTMSENEDIHLDEAITDLITQESLHRVALSAGSRIIQPTLMDFLR